jgi:hypothetical protein
MWQVLSTTKIGLARHIGGGHALAFEQCGHALAVIDVHLAAERLDLEGFRKASGHPSRL